MFYGMKPLYRLSECVFAMMKYKRINNKKAPELYGFRGFPPCKI